MDLWQAIGSFLRRFADFRGRSSRSEYWWSYLAYVLALTVLAVLFAALATLSEAIGRAAGVLFALCLLTLAVPQLAITFRRLHDINRSAWWLLVSLLPAGQFVILVFLLKRGTDGPNRFGFDPYVGRTNGVFA